MKLIDTHCHLDENYDNKTIEELLEDLESVITIGCCLSSSNEAKKIAESNDRIYFTAGIHPNESNTFTDTTIFELEKILKSSKALAIGEIGLDYYRDTNKELQYKVFIEQLRLANKLNLPISIHGREAYEDIFDILSRDEFQNIQFIMHSYAGEFKLVEPFIDRAYISFSGIVTFKNAKIVHECCRQTPINRLLVETDSPYLSPIRGKKNYPYNVKLVAKAVADLKKIEYNEVVKATNINSKNAFGIYTKK